MKLSDNEIRSQILAHLQLKGELATSAIIKFCSAWTGPLKVRDVLQSLSEENLVTVRRANSNGKSSLFWTRVAFASDVGKQVMEQLESEIPAAKPVASQKVENIEHDVSVKDETYLPEPINLEAVTHVQTAQDEELNPLEQAKEKPPVNAELNKILKHEFNIILRKQQRRRTWAAKVLQNSEAVIKAQDKVLDYLEQEVKNPVNAELNEILKHEFNIILRKQQRRRDWAAKILQNSEAVIKDLEGKIKWLS